MYNCELVSIFWFSILVMIPLCLLLHGLEAVWRMDNISRGMLCVVIGIKVVMIMALGD